MVVIYSAFNERLFRKPVNVAMDIAPGDCGVGGEKGSQRLPNPVHVSCFNPVPDQGVPFCCSSTHALKLSDMMLKVQPASVSGDFEARGDVRKRVYREVTVRIG